MPIAMPSAMPSATPSRASTWLAPPSPCAPAPRTDAGMDRATLLAALHHLAAQLHARFPAAVRLVVHGGAVVVLHPQLAARRATPDVDYAHRAFAAEWAAQGVPDAGPRLARCIARTARARALPPDWMNAHADVALPRAHECVLPEPAPAPARAHPHRHSARGAAYDPVWADATAPANARNTLFAAPGLALVAVPWPWAVALKLARYQKHDPADIAVILRLGTAEGGTAWTRARLEAWLRERCAPMGYAAYSPQHLRAARERMRDAIRLSETLYRCTLPAPCAPQRAPAPVPYAC